MFTSEAYLGDTSIAVAIGPGTKCDSGEQIRGVSYNLDTDRPSVASLITSLGSRLPGAPPRLETGVG